jgi:hypothetical protein
MKESNAYTKGRKQKRISNKACTQRITGPERNKYDKSHNKGLENQQKFNEYKKVKRRIQKNIGRKRNHSNALKKLAARKRNRS